jgi:TatA/E family protein of Tat protein translocase
MFGGLGMGELIVIFLVVLLLFGAKRLPEIGSSLGKGIREFKGSIREIEREIQAPEAPKGEVSSTSKSPDGDEDNDDEDGNGDETGEPRRLTTSE